MKTSHEETGARTRSSPRAHSPTKLKLQTLLVPTDFSEESEKGVRYSVALAREFGARLHLLYAHEPAYVYAIPALMTAAPLGAFEEIEDRLQKKMAGLIKKQKAPGTTKVHVKTGPAHEMITTVAAESRADLICLATHGYSGLKRLLLGSTTERVIEHAPCPVLVVRETERDLLRPETESLIERIIVPVDFSANSQAGARYAIRFAASCGAVVELVHAVYVQPPIPADHPAAFRQMPAQGVIERASRRAMKDFVKDLGPVPVKLTTRVLLGRPAFEICRHANDTSADLIISSTHGETSLRHVLIGSTAQHVVRHAPCPVLVVPWEKRQPAARRGV